jgi:hypothetical protein
MVGATKAAAGGVATVGVEADGVEAVTAVAMAGVVGATVTVVATAAEARPFPKGEQL